MRAMFALLVIALAQAAAPPAEIYVRYNSPRSGASVLVKAGVAAEDARRMIQEVEAGQKPAGALRTWLSGVPDLPIAFGATTCAYTDPWSGLTITTDCRPSLSDVSGWLRSAPREAATPADLLALMRTPAGAGIVGFGPQIDRSSGVVVWAARGRLLAGDPPRVMTLSASDIRTGASVTVDASKMKDSDIERYLAAIKGAESLDSAFALMAQSANESLVAVETFLNAGIGRLRVRVARKVP
jgi:hypothetical protein